MGEGGAEPGVEAGQLILREAEASNGAVGPHGSAAGISWIRRPECRPHCRAAYGYVNDPATPPLSESECSR